MISPTSFVLCLALLTPVAFEGFAPERMHSPIPFAWTEGDAGAVSSLVVTERTGRTAAGRCTVRTRRERDGSVSLDLRTEGSGAGVDREFERVTDFAPAAYPVRDGRVSRDKTTLSYADGHLRIEDEDPGRRAVRVYELSIDRYLLRATSATVTEFDGVDPASSRATFTLTCEPGVG